MDKQKSKKRFGWWKWPLIIIYVPFALLGIFYASFEFFFRIGKDTFYELLNYQTARKELLKQLQKNNKKSGDE